MIIKRGFTIIEILVVVAIVSLLLAFAAANMGSIQATSRDADRVNDVLLIGKAVDQSYQANQGLYPKISNNLGCADQIQGLDLSIFPDRTIPKDRRPAQAATPCTGFLNGYTYSTYSSSSSTIATQQAVGYSIEVGLEKKKSDDERSLRNPSELYAHNSSSSLGSSASESGRFRYILNGPFCGDSCFSQ